MLSGGPVTCALITNLIFQFFFLLDSEQEYKIRRTQSIIPTFFISFSFVWVITDCQQMQFFPKGCLWQIEFAGLLHTVNLTIHQGNELYLVITYNYTLHSDQ